MTFAALGSNEKMGVYAAVAVLVTSIVSLVNDWGGWIVLPLLASIAMLLVLFQPSLMPTTNLPGSKGSLLLVTGLVAALGWVISAVGWIDWISNHIGSIDTLQFLVGLIASLVMAWVGWQAFQGEGGQFKMGMPAAGGTATMVPPPSAAPPAEPVASPSESAEPRLPGGAPMPPPSEPVAGQPSDEVRASFLRRSELSAFAGARSGRVAGFLAIGQHQAGQRPRLRRAHHRSRPTPLSTGRAA
jgi:hypothetical protein